MVLPHKAPGDKLVVANLEKKIARLEQELSRRSQPQIREPQYSFKRWHADEKPTPQYVFDYLNRIDKFDWDLTATKGNAKGAHFFTKEQDTLKQPYICNLGFLNPPFSEKLLKAFCRKAWAEVQCGNAKKIVALLPVWVPITLCFGNQFAMDESFSWKGA